MIDLRSDTVTLPTDQMKVAMMSAPLGDDVFEQDPTIQLLEEKGANLFGKEAALFCPSGTMTNQIAIKLHSRPPGELICDQLAHVHQYEGGGIAFNSGLSTNLLKGDRGRVTASQVESAIQPDDVHKPITQLVTIENTCNKGGGSIYALEEMQKISTLCGEHGLKFHLDGARIFNALAESDYSAQDIGPLFDTLSVCLSKGLGCPVGSILIGSKDDMRQARRIRKVMGGGMRQAGVLAAAGIYALDHHVERLKEDHRRAKLIGEFLPSRAFVKSVMPVDSNIIIFELADQFTEADFLDYLLKNKVKAVTMGNGLVRFVTHLDFDDHQLDHLLDILSRLS